MANINELKKYVDYEFSSGCYTGEDYKTFERKYLNYIRSVCKKCGWELIDTTKGHYWCAGFIKNQANKYVYFMTSDVRGKNNEWFYHLLIRRAKDNKDYRGEQNHYVALQTLEVGVDCLFQGW